MSPFRLAGLDPAPFEPLFLLDDAELDARGIVRRFADADRGFPCRVGLEDARVGEELLLLNHEHLSARSPYRASGPVYVRRGARRRVLPPGQVPPYVASRLISVRAYDRAHRMVDAQVCGPRGGRVAGGRVRTRGRGLCPPAQRPPRLLLLPGRTDLDAGGAEGLIAAGPVPMSV